MAGIGERRSALYLTAERQRLVELAEAWAEAVQSVSDPELADWLDAALRPSLVQAFADIPLH